jgi:hypothetical protein
MALAKRGEAKALALVEAARATEEAIADQEAHWIMETEWEALTAMLMVQATAARSKAARVEEAAAQEMASAAAEEEEMARDRARRTRT